jgi:oligo-1,6-glucosidase
MLSTFLHAMRGTPFYYYGDDLEMTNPGFNTITQYRDQLQTGGNITAYMKKLAFSARDKGRTPMQSDALEHTGFTAGVPSIAVNGKYPALHAAAEEKDSNSCLNYFRKLVKFHLEHPFLVYGNYTNVNNDNPDI